MRLFNFQVPELEKRSTKIKSISGSGWVTPRGEMGKTFTSPVGSREEEERGFTKKFSFCEDTGIMPKKGFVRFEDENTLVAVMGINE